jgi:hypothetical protein
MRSSGSVRHCLPDHIGCGGAPNRVGIAHTEGAFLLYLVPEDFLIVRKLQGSFAMIVFRVRRDAVPGQKSGDLADPGGRGDM